MLVAVDERNQVVNLVEGDIPRGKGFFCPGCQGAVRLKKGQVMRPHFAHVSLKDCRYFSENESAQHLQLKSELYHWLKSSEKVELERRLPEIEQIADLLVNDRLALEVQCSSLSIERLKERTQAYQQAGYTVLWLLGKDLWLKERLSQLQKQFLYFSRNMGFHLWQLDMAKGCLRLAYLIHEDWHGQLQYQIKEFPFGEGELLAILRLPYQRQKVHYFKGQQDEQLLDYIAQQLYYQVPKWMLLQAQAYERGENLLTHSLIDFYPQVRLPESRNGFVQIRQDLSAYYQNFSHYYQSLKDKSQQYLYPPSFYEKMVK